MAKFDQPAPTSDCAWRSEKAVTWIEYVFVLAFMAIIALTAKQLLTTKGKAYYSNAKQNVGQSYPSPFYTSGD